MKINKENYEMFLMQYADNELDDNELKELMSFIEIHPDVKDEFLTFKNIKINVDENEKFENKQLLYKKTTALNYLKYALPFAASLYLLFFVWQKNNNINDFVKEKTIVLKETEKQKEHAEKITNVVEQNKVNSIVKVERKEEVEKSNTKDLKKEKNLMLDKAIKNQESFVKQNEINNKQKIQKDTLMQTVKVDNNFIKEKLVEKKNEVENITYKENPITEYKVKNTLKVEMSNVDEPIISIAINEKWTRKIEKVNGLFNKMKNKVNELKNTELELIVSNNIIKKINN